MGPEPADPPDSSPVVAAGTGAQDVTQDRELLLFAYEMLLVRQQTQANLLWQTPSLALTAQAFLLTIALVADFPVTGRVLAALLGIVVALISMQTMAKHRHLENLDTFRMQAMEHQLGLPPISSRGWQHDVRHDARMPGDFPFPTSTAFSRLSSYRVWQVGLGLFAVVNLVVVVVQLVRPGLLST